MEKVFENLRVGSFISKGSLHKYLFLSMLTMILTFAGSMPHVELIEHVAYKGLLFRKKISYECEVQFTFNTAILKIAFWSSVLAIWQFENKFIQSLLRIPWIISFSHFMAKNVFRWLKFLENGFRPEVPNMYLMAFIVGMALVLELYVSTEIIVEKILRDLFSVLNGYLNESFIDEDFAFEVNLDDINSFDLGHLKELKKLQDLNEQLRVEDIVDYFEQLPRNVAEAVEETSKSKKVKSAKALASLGAKKSSGALSQALASAGKSKVEDLHSLEDIDPVKLASAKLEAGGDQNVWLDDVSALSDGEHSHISEASYSSGGDM